MSIREKAWKAAESEPWSVLFVGEDHVSEMTRLAFNLTEPDPSDTADGRFISPADAYSGIGPTISWHRACQDPNYLVGQRSVESFRRAWGALKSRHQQALPTTFVSLGPGTGQKDVAILKSLHDSAHPELPNYFAVDMSAEMLRLHYEAHAETDRAIRGMVPIKLDFSLDANVKLLRTFLDEVLGRNTPILFGLLGNTLANFSDDQETLMQLATGLLTHDEDLLLLELATSLTINESAAKKAEREYRRSPQFKNWVTSALITHTDLSVDTDRLAWFPSVDEERALVLKVAYANPAKTKVMLVDGQSFAFPAKDTIRLELTRKYKPDAIVDLIAGASLGSHARHKTTLDDGFGLELVLAGRVSDRADNEDDDGPQVFPEPNA